MAAGEAKLLEGRAKLDLRTLEINGAEHSTLGAEPEEGLRRNRPPFRTLVISAPKTGHVNQCLALCEALGWQVDEVIKVDEPVVSRRRISLLQKFLRFRSKTAYFPRHRSPEPLRIISSGSTTVPIVRAYRKLYGPELFAIFVGSPRKAQADYDVSVSTIGGEEGEPYPSTSGAKIVWIMGVLARRPRSVGRGHSKTIVMIGGANKAYDISPIGILPQLAAFYAHSESSNKDVVVAFSRRTDNQLEQLVRQIFPNWVFIDRNDRAGFEAAFSAAKEYVVTPDSITMISEACATSKPVFVFDVPCFARNTNTCRVVEGLIAGGYITRLGEPYQRTERTRLSHAHAFQEVRELEADWAYKLTIQNA